MEYSRTARCDSFRSLVWFSLRDASMRTRRPHPFKVKYQTSQPWNPFFRLDIKKTALPPLYKPPSWKTDSTYPIPYPQTPHKTPADPESGTKNHRIPPLYPSTRLSYPLTAQPPHQTTPPIPRPRIRRCTRRSYPSFPCESVSFFVFRSRIHVDK